MREINGETRLLAVIGHPISHSLSPRIQNAFLEAASLNGVYTAFDIKPDGLGAFMDAARLLGIMGFNVTMPLKEAMVPFIDVIDGEAARYGAVNTVALRGGKAYGFNTDGRGFLLALERGGEGVPRGALVLGAGGAAKTIALALAGAGTRVSVVSRRPLEGAMISAGIAHCPWSDIAMAAGGCGLLVNATPLGMHGHPEDFDDVSFVSALPKGALVYDLIYAPRETTLLKAARRAGLETMNGLSHLVCQAALSFYHFTGVEAPGSMVDALIDLCTA